MSSNLSIRNTDPRNTITIVSVNYYNTHGELIDKKLEKPKKLKPLASWYAFVPTADKKGGWGANFIVKWKSDVPVSLPIIENLMAGTSGTQGYTYTSRGQEIKDIP